jgi:ABC-2 type transport system ATP-binding protein
MPPIIEVHDLVRTFGDFTAVDRISFAVPAGQIFGFLGPNGAGKTTTIKMLTTILRPTSGSIRIAGFDPAHQQHEVRRSFGIVFQDPSLDGDLTAFENLELHGVLYGLPPAERRERIERLLCLSVNKTAVKQLAAPIQKREAAVPRCSAQYPR